VKRRSPALLFCIFAGIALPAFSQDGLRLPSRAEGSGIDPSFAAGWLSPERERLLEYDISRAIARVMTPDKAVIGVLSSLPVMGTAAMMPMQQRGEPPWVLIEELKRDKVVY